MSESRRGGWGVRGRVWACFFGEGAVDGGENGNEPGFHAVGLPHPSHIVRLLRQFSKSRAPTETAVTLDVYSDASFTLPD